MDCSAVNWEKRLKKSPRQSESCYIRLTGQVAGGCQYNVPLNVMMRIGTRQEIEVKKEEFWERFKKVGYYDC